MQAVWNNAADTVAAIIPTYNRANFLGEAIESVLAQGPIVGQVIVCDDGSNDDTASVVRRFGTRLTYLRQDNAGKAAALNNLLGHVTASFTWIVDDDDIALPGTVAQLAEALAANPQAAIAYGHPQKFHETPRGRELLREERFRPFTPDPFLGSLIDNFMLQGASLYRTSAMAEIGPFDVNLLRGQDWEYVLRTTARFSVVHVPIEVYLWRQHDGLRGPAADRHEAHEMLARWGAYDTLLIEKTLAAVPVERFSLVADGDSERSLASSHLMRAIIACRNAAWPQALEELNRFVSLAAASHAFALTTMEKAALAEVFTAYSQMLTPQAPIDQIIERLNRVQDSGLLATIRATLLATLSSLLLRYLVRRSFSRARTALAIRRKIRALGTARRAPHTLRSLNPA